MRYKRDFLEKFSKLVERDGPEEPVLIFLKDHWRFLSGPGVESMLSCDRVGTDAWRGAVLSMEFSDKANIMTIENKSYSWTTEHPFTLSSLEHTNQGCQTHFHQGPHQPHSCLQRAVIILGLYQCNYSLTVK